MGDEPQTTEAVIEAFLDAYTADTALTRTERLDLLFAVYHRHCRRVALCAVLPRDRFEAALDTFGYVAEDSFPRAGGHPIRVIRGLRLTDAAKKGEVA